MARTAQNSTHLAIEDYVNAVEQQGGLYTNYPVVINNSLTVNGAISGQSSINALSSNTTLTASQSGEVFLLNSASGVTVTLPAAQVGLTYTFIVETSVTSNDYKVTVGSSNGYLIGSVVEGASAGATDIFIGNGTSDISVTQNGSTTGGLQGSVLTVTCVTTGLWQVSGTLIGSGTVATPFATT